MNKCERMMAERMTFVSRRGRTAESQKIDWLRNMRRERKQDADKFVMNVGGFHFSTAATFRQAKIRANGCAADFRYNMGINPKIWVYERNLGILLWER